MAYAWDVMRTWRDRGPRRPSLRAAGLALSSLAAIATAAGCLRSGSPLIPYQDDAGPPPAIVLGGDDAGRLGDVDLGDPFAITGLQPSHGPWTGGTHATIAGRGFSSSIQVWIGSTQLDPSAVLASDPTRASVVTPQGTPGAADVRVRNIATAEERTLAAGFFYDSFVVSPDTGATTGGTRIALQGSGTQWASTSTVAIDGMPCTAVSVTDATDLSCTTPAGSPGTQDVTVTNADGTLDQARDAFTYSDSPDGYRGGLSGGTLSGSLTVLAFDALTGAPLTGGRAIAGSSIATAILGTFDSSGTVRLSGASLNGTVTITVAAKCHQPITFVDVPVDTVTAYLDPELDPSCGQGDPPSSGNYYATSNGSVVGELVWPTGPEFSNASWANVPMPTGTQRRAAYVFPTTANPLDPFQLPSTYFATTPDSTGEVGFQYSATAQPGNQTLYALAGLEDRTVSPPWFEPYAMGVARGVLVQPGQQTSGIDIPISTLLDHAVITQPQPPQPTPLGPDRLLSTLAIDVGASQFAILPQGTISSLLPISGQVSFVGAPSLDGTLSGCLYDLTASAVTGANGLAPMSVVNRIETTVANDPVTVGGFFAIPALLQPSAANWSGTHITLQATGAIDLVDVQITSGNGLVTWQIVAPGSDLSFDVPDLSQIAGVTSLVPGPTVITFAIARLTSFQYASLRYGQFAAVPSGAWSAFALDTTTGSY
jgi:IPT/TIG domain-containing protein